MSWKIILKENTSNKINSILIIDDDDDLLFLAEQFLKRKNINVHKASTGESGIALFKNIAIEIDVIILDHSFKNSKLQGIDILPALKKIDNNAVVVISSGYPIDYFKDTYPDKVYELIDGFVNKTYSSPDFVPKLENIFNKQES